MYEIDEEGTVVDNVNLEVQSEGFTWDEWDMEVIGSLQEEDRDWLTIVLYQGPCELPQVTLQRISRSGRPLSFYGMDYIRKTGCPGAYDGWSPMGGFVAEGTIRYEWDEESITLTFDDVWLHSEGPTDLPRFTSIRMHGEYTAQVRESPCAM